ncbi:MAG: glycosyltransferase family 9 protein [Vampirovibrionales bacterium]|nr:glycosyltransferase family 9 protein [Vampirovibrionales bacterium]
MPSQPVSQRQDISSFLARDGLFESPDAPRILISRLSAHGDVVQGLPLLDVLRAKWPNAHIGWLVERSAASLLEGHPFIDQLHVCQRKDWLRRLSTPMQWAKILQEISGFCREIRLTRYDVSLDVQGLLKSAIWPWVCGIPKRFGNKNARERADIFYNYKLPPHPIDASTPAIDQYLSFASALGVSPDFPALQNTHFTLPAISEDTWQKVDALFSTVSKDKPVVAVAPATIWPSKHWHQAHWYGLLKTLSEWDVSVVVLGASNDMALVSQLLPQPLTANLYNFCGQTDLSDLYALFQKVDVLIGLDSAPLHIANAVASHTGKKPDIIALFGSTAAERTGPVGERHRSLQTRLDCQPCFERICPLGTHECMKALSPNTVLENLKRMLAAQKLFQPVIRRSAH